MAASQDRAYFWRRHFVDRTTGNVLPRDPAPFVSRRKRKFRRSSTGPGPSYRWRDYLGGALDGRGDYRSPKRLRRLALCQQAGMPSASGRQWVRLRRLIASARRTMGGAQ